MERSCEPPDRFLDFGLADDDGLGVELGHQVQDYSEWRIPAGDTVRISSFASLASRLGRPSKRSELS